MGGLPWQSARSDQATAVSWHRRRCGESSRSQPAAVGWRHRKCGESRAAAMGSGPELKNSSYNSKEVGRISVIR
jgi:hypothetical protein